MAYDVVNLHLNIAKTDKGKYILTVVLDEGLPKYIESDDLSTIHRYVSDIISDLEDYE